MNIDKMLGSKCDMEKTEVALAVRLGMMIMHTVNGTVYHAEEPPKTFHAGSLTHDLVDSEYEDNVAMWAQTIETMRPVTQEEYLTPAKVGGHKFQFADNSLHYMTSVGQVANNYIHNMQALAGYHDERVVRAQGLLVPIPCGFTIPICCPLALICPICPTIVVGLPALFCCIV